MPVAMRFKVDAVQASDEFKRIRRDIGGLMRDTVVKVGTSQVVPLIKAKMTIKSADDANRGLPVAAMQSSIYIRRDRTTVIIASRLTGAKNRALGWIDFGGQRARDTTRRTGTHAILSGVDAKRPVIDAELLRALLEEFAKSGFEVS